MAVPLLGRGRRQKHPGPDSARLDCFLHHIHGAGCKYWFKSTLLCTSCRTNCCCDSTRSFASITTKLNSVLIARYCSKILPWKMRKLSYGSLDRCRSIPASKYFNCGRPSRIRCSDTSSFALKKNVISGSAAKL